MAHEGTARTCYNPGAHEPHMLPRWFFLSAVFLTIGGGLLPAQTLEVTPNHILVDESAVIRASGLQPNERITIRAELQDGGSHKWTSEAEFIADAQGVVDASQQPPVKGSYSELSPMGLIWCMLPAEKHVASYESPRDLGSQAIKFSLVRNKTTIASAQLEQRMIAEGVQRVIVHGQLHGVLFLPAGTERHPAVLVLGGSEGGVPHARAAWLASRGYAAFALAYFHYEDLPQQLAGIPMEYFARALGWLRERPEVLPDRIAVMGVSRGGELALQLGSMIAEVKAVVAYVPASFRHPACCGQTPVPYAWTFQGQPLSYVPLRAMRDATLKMQAAIAVERTKGPILLISGQDDGVWESSNMAESIVDRLRQAHFPYRVEHLKYPHAGHRAGRPEIVPTWHGEMEHPVSGKPVSLGGSAKGDAESSMDAIPKVLEFLRQSLQQPSAP
jgi:dienelactone hydrolase